MNRSHRRTVVALLLLSCVPWRAGSAEPPPSDNLGIALDRVRAAVKYLASDQLEGRGIGTRGEELATDYIAKEFEKAGLRPAGERGTFFQTVPLLRVATEPAATLSASIGDRAVDFRCEQDFAGQSRTQQPVADFDAEAVFVGHGIVAPEFGWDDYQGSDVRGKVVVLFTNEPPSEDPKFFNGRALTYYGRWTFKFEEAARQGAKAALIIHTPETAGYPYSVVKTLEGVQVGKAAGDPALAFAGWMSADAGEKLLVLAGMTVAGALKDADRRGFKAAPLGVRIKGHIPAKLTKVVSKNVVGTVEGSDPALKSQAVLYSAHWDHLGMRKTALGDNIYNGAADNGTGCAILLELARIWSAQKPRPKRSAVFLATTAEESGLLGAEYYGQHPAVPLGQTAINLNFDTLHPLGVPESVVVGGAERTTAWETVREVAGRLNLDIEPDKLAHLGMYYRSDHFALARGGVPAFSVHSGARIKGKPPDFYKKAVDEFIATRYHTPQDEYREDWDFSGYPALIRFGFTVGRDIANAEKLPTWAPGDEFRPAREKSGVR